MVKHFFQSAWFSSACWLGVALFSPLAGGIVRSTEPTPSEGARFFREKIEPVLKKECFGCHSTQAKEIKGGLRLDSRLGLRRGGDSGVVVVEGKAEKSRLVQAIRHEGDLVMPPEKPKLPAQTIADFVKWVELGAPDPRDRKSVV